MSPPAFLSPSWCGTRRCSPVPRSEHPQRLGVSIAAPTAELRGLESPRGLFLSSDGSSQRGDMDLDPAGAVPSLPPSPCLVEHPQGDIAAPTAELRGLDPGTSIPGALPILPRLIPPWGHGSGFQRSSARCARGWWGIPRPAGWALLEQLPPVLEHPHPSPGLSHSSQGVETGLRSQRSCGLAASPPAAAVAGVTCHRCHSAPIPPAATARPWNNNEDPGAAALRATSPRPPGMGDNVCHGQGSPERC